MTTPTHITWEKILAVCSAFVIPGIGLMVTVVIFGTRIDDKISNIQQRQDKQDEVTHAMQSDINGIRTQVDTIKAKQLQYHYENLIYRAKTDKR